MTIKNVKQIRFLLIFIFPRSPSFLFLFLLFYFSKRNRRFWHLLSPELKSKVAVHIWFLGTGTFNCLLADTRNGTRSKTLNCSLLNRLSFQVLKSGIRPFFYTFSQSSRIFFSFLFFFFLEIKLVSKHILCINCMQRKKIMLND